MRTTTRMITAVALVAMSAAAASADDWPTYRHDNHRSGVTNQALKTPLKEAWTYQSPAPPQPAWEGPAKWDAYASIKGLASMRDFDPTFFVTAADGKVYFGSSVTDAAVCLDAATGKKAWSYVTGGPVRLPPTLFDGKALFGSDDGKAYCVDAGTGKLIWQYAPPVEDDRRIPNNGKLISLWPVRTGVLVADAKAYFGASLLPWRPSYLCAVDAKTGKAQGEGLFTTKFNNLTLQGALLSAGPHLLAMQGRYAPMMFNRTNGQALGSLDRRGRVGGVYALVTADDKIAYGYGSKKPAIFVHNAANRARVAQFAGASRILIVPNSTFMHRGNELMRENAIAKAAGPEQIRKLYLEYVQLHSHARKLVKAAEAEKDAAKKAPLTQQAADATAKAKAKKAELQAAKKAAAGGSSWKITFPVVHDMILAGKSLIVGGNDKVTVLDADTGKEVWSARVSGKAQGLAVAGGRLLVSTSDGTIHCFAAP